MRSKRAAGSAAAWVGADTEGNSLAPMLQRKLDRNYRYEIAQILTWSVPEGVQTSLQGIDVKRFLNSSSFAWLARWKQNAPERILRLAVVTLG